MARNRKNISFSRDAILVTVGVFLLAIFLTSVVYAFVFLINNVLPAITAGDDSTDSGEVRFNLEGFEELGL